MQAGGSGCDGGSGSVPAVKASDQSVPSDVETADSEASRTRKRYWARVRRSIMVTKSCGDSYEKIMAAHFFSL